MIFIGNRAKIKVDSPINIGFSRGSPIVYPQFPPQKPMKYLNFNYLSKKPIKSLKNWGKGKLRLLLSYYALFLMKPSAQNPLKKMPEN